MNMTEEKRTQREKALDFPVAFIGDINNFNPSSYHPTHVIRDLDRRKLYQFRVSRADPRAGFTSFDFISPVQFGKEVMMMREDIREGNYIPKVYVYEPSINHIPGGTR